MRTWNLLMLLMFAFSINAQYKIGDVYCVNGVKGIVVRTDSDGNHGLIMSLDKCSEKWCSDNKSKFLTDAFYEDDGEKNMKVIDNYIKENGKSWDLFPFLQWCKNKGDGWYAPAIEEMKSIITAMNGSVGTYNEYNCHKFDELLKANGGDSMYGNVELPMGGKMVYTMWTSTEANKGKVYAGAFFQTSPFGSPSAKVFEMKKTHANYLGSRAVHKF